MIWFPGTWQQSFLIFLLIGYNALFYSTAGFIPGVPPWRIATTNNSRSIKSKLSQQEDNHKSDDERRRILDLEMEARQMLEKAKVIRESLPVADQSQNKNSDTNLLLNDKESSAVGYRLYIDIGREEGTWMDPKWGSSGRRIQGSMDVYFQTTLADGDIVGKMIQDNIAKKSSSTAVRTLDCSKARLRKGFDQMACHGGGYRIDVGNSAGNQKRIASSTLRFFIDVDGTNQIDSSYGDIFIPKGPLYFSLPCFCESIYRLSRKDGIISVRQVGWHTGWRRMESRIIGVFRAVPIQDAKKKDGF